MELPLILRTLFVGTFWSEVGESILTPIELADGDGEEGEEKDGEGDEEDGKEDICAEAGASVMESNEVKLKVFQIRAKIKTAKI